MTFSVAKFKFLQKVRKTEDYYGENAAVALRDSAYYKKKPSQVEHSFPHLIGKRIQVPQYNLPEVFSNEKPQHYYGVTDQERVRIALNRAAQAKTAFDD